MESAGSPMTITIVILLEGELPLDTVVQRVEERLLSEPRLRARVHDRVLGPTWEPQHVDVRAHVRAAQLRAPGDRTALEALVSELASVPLDPDRPLWDLHVVAGPETALVLRVHHALADGLALVGLLARLADGEVRPRAPSRPPPPALLARLAPVVGMARLALSRPDPDTALRGPVSARKELAFSDPVPLAPIRDAAHRAGVGLGAMLLACTSGALRRALEEEGARVDRRLRLRAMVPVSVRDTGDEPLGNRYVSVIVPLPVGLASHDARVAALRAQAGILHRPAAVDLGRRVIALLGVGGAALEQRAVEQLTRKASLVVSSVPGPEEPLSIAGHRVTGVIGFAPVTGSLSLGITLLGCGGELRAGVMRGSPRGPRARTIAQRLETELRGPWRPSPGGGR